MEDFILLCSALIISSLWHTSSPQPVKLHNSVKGSLWRIYDIWYLKIFSFSQFGLALSSNRIIILQIEMYEEIIWIIDTRISGEIGLPPMILSVKFL